MKKIVRKFTAGVLTGIVAVGMTAAVAAEPFSTEKRQEVEKIVRDYLLANPEILVEVSQELQRREQTMRDLQARQVLGQVGDRMFRSEHTYVAGNPDGDITLVEFFDYNCGYCKRSVDNILNFIKSDPNVRVVMREFPILSEGSIIAARAALASRKQDKYWDFHLALMRTGGLQKEEHVMRVAESVGLDIEKLKADMKSPSVDAAIREGHELAQAVGIQGTPTFVMDDKIINNSTDLIDVLKKTVADIRASGGCTVC